jgi:hypothetical protein
MKTLFEVGPVAKACIPSFIKTGFGVQKFKGRIHRHTDRMEIA